MRPGWKTTEFWMSLATLVAVYDFVRRGLIPPTEGTQYILALCAAYTGARVYGKTKNGPEAKP